MRYGRRVCSLPLMLLMIGAVAPGPLLAQKELSGQWQQKMFEDAPERVAGAWIGDYTGMPINDVARMRGDTWSSSSWTQVERQCVTASPDFAYRGSSQLRIFDDVDQLTQGVTAWHINTNITFLNRDIYMDDRPHPPPWAANTWEGFSTGEWEGDALKITTTHLREGWVRRNGLVRSDQGTLIEYLVRHHRYLTMVTIVEDPIYLSEPLIRTSDWVQAEGALNYPNVCIPGVEVEHERGWVPNYLPGKNPYLYEWADRVGIPHQATRGGAETMYPEYQKKLATMTVVKTEQSAAKGAQ